MVCGISGYGVYVPRRRLSRPAILAACDWYDRSLSRLAKGHRSVCNWDEDSLTMAVEAARICLSSSNTVPNGHLVLASTSFPFKDRQCSVLLAEALNVSREIRCMDIASSRKAGTTALLSSLERASTADDLIVASEHIRTKSGSLQEMLGGDAAAAIRTGRRGVIAEFLDGLSLANDFVDHYVGENGLGSSWEERWVRDEGLVRALPEVIESLLRRQGLTPAQLRFAILPGQNRKLNMAVARRANIAPSVVLDAADARVGFTGTSQPLLLLAYALEKCAPGDFILLTGFGQGTDALLLRCTPSIRGYKSGTSVEEALAGGVEDENYSRHLAFLGSVAREEGKRSELDKQTFLSAFNRHRKLITSLIGGRCRSCDTPQIPATGYCIHPECDNYDDFEDYCFSGRAARLKSWTADWLTYTPSPPAIYGMVDFEGGGRLMMDFTDTEADQLELGLPVSLHFRIREIDRKRGFKKYFWKAKPVLKQRQDCQIG